MTLTNWGTAPLAVVAVRKAGVGLVMLATSSPLVLGATVILGSWLAYRAWTK